MGGDHRTQRWTVLDLTARVVSVTNTAAAIDFSRKPTADMEPEFWAYFSTSDLPSCEAWTLVWVERVEGQRALVDFEDMPTWTSLDDLRLPKLVCEECGEPAQEQPPLFYGRPLGPQRFSHLDGEPMCPTMGSDGYEPCRAV
jgi:hypothetical protein